MMDVCVDLALIEDKLEIIIECLEGFNPALIQLNGYFYLLIFLLAGVGMIYLFYKFLKIFI